MRLSSLLALSLLLPLLAPGREARGDAGSEALESLRDALRKEDPEARKAGVLEFCPRAPALATAQAQRASVILRKAFEEEGTAEVRRVVVRALSRLPTPTAWVPVILASFRDRDPEVRRAARTAVLSARSGFLGVVQRLLAEDEDPTFRANLLLILRDRRDAAALPLLLDALGDHPRVAAAALEALEAISGQAYGYDVAAWRQWFDKRSQPAPPVGGGSEETVTVAPSETVEEPPPFVGKSLVPDFYGLQLHEKDVVFVVDVSGSVGGGGIERAKKELVDAVERLGSDVRVAALFFAEDVKMWRPEMVPATPENKAELALFLRGIEAGKRTDLMTPVNAGLQILQRRIEEKTTAKEPFREAVAMIVVSDGLENATHTPAAIVAEKVDRLDLGHAVIHSVVLGGKDSALMHLLSTRAGGRYVVVPR